MVTNKWEVVSLGLSRSPIIAIYFVIAEENCTITIFVIGTLHQILLV
jgi:hypothetical protein